MSNYTPGKGLPSALPLGSSGSTPLSQARTNSDATRGTNTPATMSPESPPVKRRRRVDTELLRDIATSMPDRDREVLNLIDEHRYLTTHHLQAFAFTEHTSDESAARTTRHVLQRLDRLALIRPLGRRIGGVRGGSASRIWQLAPAGARLLRDDGGSHRTHEPSTRFLAHCLAIADVHLALRDLNDIETVSRVRVQLEPMSWRRFSGPGGEPRWVHPDLAAVASSADFDDRWFIEVDLGTESLPTLLRKCGQYEAYRGSGLEQSEHGAFPLVLWFFSDPERADRLRSSILRSPRLTSELYRFSTAETFATVIREPLS